MRISPFAGIIQIKFNRMISERRAAGHRSSCSSTKCTLIRQNHATRFHVFMVAQGGAGCVLELLLGLYERSRCLDESL